MEDSVDRSAVRARSEDRWGLVPMRLRDPQERGRTSTSLELFFDLTFVISVSVASDQLHSAFAAGDALGGLAAYAMVFFAIWWAWMNFSWFATSFDTDDWLYRFLTVLQMGGVLVLAAGIPAVFDTGDLTLVTFGYVVMRVSLVFQWLRAARTEPRTRRTALAYALGISVVQVFWLLALALPLSWTPVCFVALMLAELSVPVVAERRGGTAWNAEHITERYGLFTLIVLGESLLASAAAVIGALQEDADLVGLMLVSVLALGTTAALWWIYFWPPHLRAISGIGRSLFYGYGHYVVFAAAGAVSVGIELQIDLLLGSPGPGPLTASFAHSIPVAMCLFGIWLITIRPVVNRRISAVLLAGVVVILLDPLLPLPVALTTLVLAGIVVMLERHRRSEPLPA